MSSQKFTKDVGIVVLTNILIALRSLIILPIITKLLGVESYGIWVQIIVTVGLLAPFVTLGLPYTLVRFLAGEKNKTEIRDGLCSVLILIFIVTSMAGVFLFVFSQSVSSFLGCESILIKILAFVILFEGLNSVFYFEIIFEIPPSFVFRQKSDS